ncbi:hypothetical protein JCM3766R1_004844 [Sporobolomyces carnicolor]
MPFLNQYKAPRALPVSNYHSDTPLQEYDLNFCYPIPRQLQSSGVKLVPLIPSLHGERLFELFKPSPDSFKWLPYGPFATVDELLTLFETKVRLDPGTLLFTVYDLSLRFDRDPEEEEEEDFEQEGGRGMRLERIAGIVGVLKGVPANRSIEIGHLHIAPRFQRTHVLTHSIALLMHWLLDPPTPSSTCLGLRRVQWFANQLNLPSIRAAERLGFRIESSGLWWERVISAAADDKPGIDLPDFLNHDRQDKDTTTTRKKVEEARGKGRHSVVLSVDWETWNDSVRDRVKLLVERAVTPRQFQ